jgi:hypothetical protein
MATYNWSALSNGQVLNFNPSVDVLRFDNTAISAADVDTYSTSGVVDIVFTHAGKTVTLQTSSLSITRNNVTFANGSMLLIGDDSTGTTGDAGNNTLTSGSGNDKLIGGAGSDTLNGGDGNDVFQIAHGYDFSTPAGRSYGNDTLNGGSGTDRMFYNVTNGYGVQINFATGQATGGDGEGSVLTLNSIEWADGTAFADTFTGSGANEFFRGFQGNDSINGGAGTDTAIFTGARASYSITTQSNGSIVVSGGNDGADTLTGIERLQFTDQTIDAPGGGGGGGGGNVAPVVTPTAATQTVAANATVGAGTLFSATDANGNGTIAAYEFVDVGVGGGRFRVNGTAMGEGDGSNWTVSAAQLGQTTYTGGASAGSETVWVRAQDSSGAYSTWRSWTMQTQAGGGGGGGNVAPVVTPTAATQTVATNATVGAGTLFSATDANGNGTIAAYEFVDVGVGGGRFRVNGTAMGEGDGSNWTVSAAQLGQTTYTGGASAGSETVWVRAQDSSGAYSTWRSWTMQTQAGGGGGGGNVAPVVTPTAATQTVAANATVGAGTLFSATDANGNGTIAAYEFVDVGVGGGRFRVNGTAMGEGDGSNWTVSAAQLGQTTYTGGASAGSETVWVRAQDSSGAYSTWQKWTMQTQAGGGGGGGNVAPVVTPTAANQSVARNATVAAGTLFSATDANGNGTITQYEFVDAYAANGHFAVNGTARAGGDGTNFIVSAAQLAQTTYVGGSSAGTDLLWVRASDGTAWSDWKSWNMSTLA